MVIHYSTFSILCCESLVHLSCRYAFICCSFCISHGPNFSTLEMNQRSPFDFNFEIQRYEQKEILQKLIWFPHLLNSGNCERDIPEPIISLLYLASHFILPMILILYTTWSTEVNLNYSENFYNLGKMGSLWAH